jgi:hypothetical protein
MKPWPKKAYTEKACHLSEAAYLIKIQIKLSCRLQQGINKS